MHEDITRQISSENYIKADEQITHALKRSFDISISKDRTEFENLHKLRDEIVQNIMLKNDATSVDNFRSSVQVDKKNYNPQIYEEKFLEIVDSIEDNIVSQNKSTDFDSTVNILLHPIKTDNNTFAALSEAGLYADDPDYGCFEQIYLRGYNNNKQVNIKKIMEGLNYIATGLIEENMEDVVIYFPIMYEDFSESALFLTLYSILYSTIMFTVSTQVSENKKINIFWSFGDLQIEELFRKVITKAKIIKAKPQIIESSVNHLKKRVLTKNDKFIKQLKSVAHIIDEADVPILILGETGVGKSFLAKIIHETSSRQGKFISVNCSSITESLIESELFGTKKGTATGVEKRIGKIAAAEGGTIFLDEIDRASRKFRDAVLTFIDTKEYTPVGGRNLVKADVRLVYGSNKDFQKLIAQNKFEDDFLSRIDERIINIPPLRDRPEDIEGIVENILLDLNEKKGVDIGVSSDVISKLSNLELKGNIRDLNKIVKYGFYESVYQDKYGVISLSQYENYSFSNSGINSEFYQLLDLAKSLMLNYNFFEGKIQTTDSKKFNLIENLIKPIFAHIFLHEIYQEENLKWREQNSTAISGSSLEGGERATMKKKSKEFQKILEMF